MGFPAWVINNIPTLLRPLLLLSLSIYHFTLTVYETIFVEKQPKQLFDLRKLRFKSFARLWTHHGEEMSVEMPGPLTDLLSQCHGVVLDIGPGSGQILPRFDPKLITAMYGAEPAAELHPALLKNAKKFGFGDKYNNLLCGAEPESLIPALDKSGVLRQMNGRISEKSEGVFDEICCVRVLCGVPTPKETIRGLYNLLKPGGRMVICEHVVNPWRTEGRIAARAMQLFYTLLGWPFFMGGCELQRHTFDYLKEAAGEEGWASFNLQYIEPKTTVPFIVGELKKRS
ncbi:S-adenosyl-L-methionine-dependent methyltransferase [Lojkania enalia]|uniref:S-adenosyl-L-methionine-dependent methyltransferase n=1 Tax=Lojkania enalia TaxID=147567 RepID=A0A9P4K7N3_9PLEO|nr:S-adenosyl-L-methionine-dependent methyltransferase [Didymosphaeria enalia]